MAQEGKHTPAPWTIIPAVEYDGDDDELIGAYTSPAGIEGADGNPVCAFGIAEGSGTLFENEADYHLIAAAPDLLAALRVFADLPMPPTNGYTLYTREDIFAARAAIAKAEGRSNA